MSTRPQTIRVGASSCLLGHAVRFDSGHKHQPYITEVIGQFFELVGICPETGIGMNTPRPPIRLVRMSNSIRAIGTKDSTLDVTDLLTDFAHKIAPQLEELSGYIVKKDSPSCGMERVKLYDNPSMPTRDGVGIYTAELMKTFPLLPIEEEGRLADPVLRENFIERVYVYARWRELKNEGITAAKLVEFHTRHKYMVMSRGQNEYLKLGQLVARAGSDDILSLSQAYIETLMNALRQRATRKQHSNVLMHLLGYLKKNLDREDKVELLQLIDEYRFGKLPLIVPLTLLKHHLRRVPKSYLHNQHYLQPHPSELMLRNYI